MRFGRRIGLPVTDWTPRARLVHVEAIAPGSPEDLFNRADASCESCDGMGRVSVRTDEGRGWQTCPCTGEGTR